MLKVYEYEKCDTCRKARQYLDRLGVRYERIPIVDRPPSARELAAMLRAVGDVRKLFNTSGQLYRELGVGERLKTMGEDEALRLLASHGKLIKRPFVLGEGVSLIGFREPQWRQALKERAE
jgi:arsenate reductase